jgi:hypothetical protein
MPADVANLSADALLAVPADCPEHLFTGGAEDVRQDYRRLAMRWHPDRCADPQAHAVFQHVAQLYGQAEARIRRGDWTCRAPLRLVAIDGRTYDIHYLRRHPFELGTMFVGATIAAFVVGREHADLVDNAERTLRALPWADARMRAQIAGLLPAYPFAGAFATDDAYVIVMRKRPDVLLLRDVLDHAGGRLDPRHVAWIVSALLNVCCYLQYAGLVHNALSPDTCFLAPPDHTVSVLGGWWYAAAAGRRKVAAPAATIAWGPHHLLASGRADMRTDLELVRAIGRELLGDVSGVRLARTGAAPAALIDWLRLPASSDPIEDYRTWRTRVLPDSFGARRFVELPLTQSDIYG